MSYWKAPLRQAVTVTLAALAIGCGPQGGATAGSALRMLSANRAVAADGRDWTSPRKAPIRTCLARSAA